MFNKSKRKEVYNIKSIEEICNETWEPLYRYIYFKVQNQEEAEEITQESYLKALSYPKKSSIENDKYIAFLKTIALNIIRDRYRGRKRKGIRVNLENINPVELSISDNTESSTHRILIEDAMSKLNEEQYMVIDLRIIKGYSVAETAKLMNKNEGTIRVLQHRTLKILANILDESYKGGRSNE